MFNKIFESGKIGNLEIKNRMVVPPMLTEYANEDGSINERFIRYYEEKAKGDFGLIIIEDTAVERRGAGFMCLPGLWSDELSKKHIELTKRVKAHGAKIAVQLYHAGREGSSSVNGGMQIVAPSAIQDPTNLELPHELTTEEVRELVEKFAQAARRAKEAGYDAVELHGAHGYLVNQFVSPYSNKRTDEFGGTFMNRLKFPLDIIKRIKELNGHDFPIIYRITADEMVEGGLNINDTKMIVSILEKEGIAAVHVSASVYKSGYWASAPTTAPTTPFVKYAAEIKTVVNSIPVIAVNKINTPFIAENILKEGQADFVSMGRASIADPYLPKKTKEGKINDIVFCVGCWQGCQGMIAKQKPVTCLVNPSVGKEEEYTVKEAEIKKKVMVVGGGVGGMQAAIIASKRGHDVSLYEKTEKLGGQWLLAAVPPGKEPLNTFTVWQKHQLNVNKVKVYTGIEVTEELIRKVNPNHIILATGANPIMPKIPGINLPHVVQANDILSGKELMKNNAVIIGGGLVGAEVAEQYGEHVMGVTVVEMTSEIAGGMEMAPKKFLMKHLNESRVKLMVNTKVIEIKSNSVVIECEGKIEEIGAEQVVIAIGSKSENILEPLIKDKYKYNVIGDATKVGRALEAIEMGYVAGISI